MNTRENNVMTIRLQDTEHEAQQRRVEYIRAEFMRAAKLGDMSAPAPWAPAVDWGYGNRKLTVGEAIYQAVDLGDGPTTNDVLGLLCTAAFVNNTEFTAYQLLNRLADQFVKHCA